LDWGASAKHVIGNTGSGSAHSHSATPMLLRYLATQNVTATHSAGDAPPAKEGGERLALIGVELATTQIYGPKENLEFMAKRLLSGKLDDRTKKTVLLGTPLYVAIADEGTLSA
jgi:uncharacterized protein DUF7019